MDIWYLLRPWATLPSRAKLLLLQHHLGEFMAAISLIVLFKKKNYRLFLYMEWIEWVINLNNWRFLLLLLLFVFEWTFCGIFFFLIIVVWHNLVFVWAFFAIIWTYLFIYLFLRSYGLCLWAQDYFGKKCYRLQ